MSARLHYAVGTDMCGEWEMVPVCGNDFRRAKKLTDDPAKVTCRECLTLCGFDAVPAEQLTVCQPEPIRRVA